MKTRKYNRNTKKNLARQKGGSQKKTSKQKSGSQKKTSKQKSGSPKKTLTEKERKRKERWERYAAMFQERSMDCPDKPGQYNDGRRSPDQRDSENEEEKVIRLKKKTENKRKHEESLKNMII
jgi:hypothetical protein